MEKLKNIVKKINKIPKIKYISILIIIILAITISIPTLARYKNRLDLESILTNSESWDGTVATSYHKGNGTKNDPYIISNAKELAYFANQLETTDYTNTYFKLSNDIIINNGTFAYDNDQITYVLDDTTMYVKEYSSDLYANATYSDTAISSINNFSSLDNFQGYFDGDYYRIYGLYMTSTSEELALFTNLSGTVENLYIENALIYGGASTAVLASSTNNATITNIYTNGIVVGTSSNTEDTKIYQITDYTATKDTTTFTDNLTLPTLNYQTIKEIHLTGTYTSTELTQSILIDGSKINPGDFDLDLGTKPLTDISLEVTDEIASNISLTNLQYEITYETGVASGVVASATNTTLTNIINKADVISVVNAAGLIGLSTNINIENAYNTGNVIATNSASGLISSIKNSTDTVTISKTYNAGTLTAATTNSFVGDISNNTNVTIENTFNTATSQVNLQTDQILILNNVYDVNTSTITGITQTSLKAINTKDTLINTLDYAEYVDSEYLDDNSNAVWIYETYYLPILYFDDLNNPIAVLNVGTYNWEDLGYELKDIYLSSDTAFKITAKDSNETIEAYYYIHKDKSSLTKEQIENITDWTEYTDIVTLKTEGYYVIYVKAIDSENNVKYINSEQLILDKTAPIATITMNDNTWSTYTEDLSNVNISDTTTVSVETTDTYSEVTSTKYNISNILLTEDELNELDDDDWTTYTDAITIDSKGTYVINVKTTDARNHTAYYNTDYIVFGGYSQSLNLGREEDTYPSLNITNDSTVTYNFTYAEQTSYKDGYVNALVVTSALPLNTKITLINNNTSEVYKYIVESTKTTYYLNDFVKLGQTNTSNTFVDKDFIEETTKNISFVLDFSNTEITTQTTINAYLELHNSSDKTILSTLRTTTAPITIYSDNEPSLIINKTSTIETINISTDSKTTISLETYLNYNSSNNEKIYDSSLENQKIGLAVKLVDENDEIVSKNNLKNITFQIGDNYYSPDNDGIVRIPLTSDLTSKVTTNLIITTYATTTSLATGTYNFIVTPYLAADGKYTNNLTNSSKITIYAEATMTKDEVKYGFNVTMDSDDRVIYKQQETSTLNFTINETSTFTNSNIRVSLYKKKSLTAYDQTYELVDLQEYVTTTLDEVEENIYYVTTSNLALSMNNTKFEKTGYELRFELYDGNNFITVIKKKFIVR